MHFIEILSVVFCAISVFPDQIVAGDISNAMIKDAFKNCISETGAAEAETEHIIKHQPTTSREGKCLRACVMKKFNTMTPDGKFSEPDLIKISEIYTKGDSAQEKMAKEIISACDSVPFTDDQCQTAEDYSTCIQKEGKARGATFEL